MYNWKINYNKSIKY